MSSVSGTLKTSGVSTSSSSATPGPTEPTRPSSPKGPPETVKYITATSGPSVSAEDRRIQLQVYAAASDSANWSCSSVALPGRSSRSDASALTTSWDRRSGVPGELTWRSRAAVDRSRHQGGGRPPVEREPAGQALVQP